MASCNNDKLKAFLTKPTMRKRRRLDEAQEAEHQADNRFIGKIFFEARVLTLPTDLSEPILVMGSEDVYEFVTYVKRFDLDDNLLDPIDAVSADKAITAILNCPQAVVTSTKNIQVGDIVTVQLNTPAQQGVSEFFSIVNKIATDDEYADKLSRKIDESGGQTQQTFDNLSRDQQIQAEINRLAAATTPEKLTLKATDNVVKNGTLTDADFDFLLNVNGTKVTSPGLVYDSNKILLDYRSTDPNGGIAFAKVAGENYANKFKELCRAYRTEAIAQGWSVKYIIINSCFRSYAKQLYLEATQPALSAAPGTSNHGWGMAFDWGSGIVRVRDLVGTDQHTWMVANAPTYGFESTLNRTGEAWHFEISDRDQVYKQE